MGMIQCMALQEIALVLLAFPWPTASPGSYVRAKFFPHVEQEYGFSRVSKAIKFMASITLFLNGFLTYVNDNAC
jgi:hypothetical protein